MTVKHFPISWLALVCYSLFITYMSLIAGDGEGDITDLKQYKIPHLDKLLHIGAYWLYALLALFACQGSHTRWLPPSLLTLLMMHGISLEYFQITQTTGREASLPDVIANGSGLALGYLTMVKHQTSLAKSRR